MTDTPAAARAPAMGSGGMAATSSPDATRAALEVLRHGGNALDAAVTASAVLCITEPHMTGIGGDCFAMLCKPGAPPLGLNGAGTSAAAATPDWLAASGLRTIAPHSIHAVTVPGAIDAWDRLLKAHGTVSLAEALAPAIDLAERGHAVQPRVARDWQSQTDLLAQDAGARLHYLPRGVAPVAGDVMRYPALAQTLRTIAQEGRDAFYQGSLARDMVETLRARGSLLDLSDFAATEATWVEPVKTAFMGREIWELPPPGQGLTVLLALNTLARLDLQGLDPQSPQRKHLEVEAMKRAWHLRNAHIADPRCGAVPVEELLSAALADRMAASIDPHRASALVVDLPRSDTVYLAVVDGQGMACSFINSIYWSFGAGVATERTGIVLQNRGAGFVCTPGHPNVMAPRKRPLHTLIPALATQDGALDMVFGVMGGDYQPMGHVMVALNAYVSGLDPQAALDLPRLVPDAGEVEIEEGFSPAFRRDFAALGHVLKPDEEPLGGGQIIRRHAGGLWSGGSDPRKDGFAAALFTAS